jgi:hypothetical protein
MSISGVIHWCFKEHRPTWMGGLDDESLKREGERTAFGGWPAFQSSENNRADK